MSDQPKDDQSKDAVLYALGAACTRVPWRENTINWRPPTWYGGKTSL